jgi:outer membrane lipoprotein-sorting protein
MRRSLWLLTLAAAWPTLPSDLPAPLLNHTKKLSNANALQVEVSAQQLPGAPQTWTIAFAKPASLRIEGPGTLVVSDGKKVWSYDKTKKVYTEADATPEALAQAVQAPEVWGWASFFVADTGKIFAGGRAGAKRTVRGVQVTEVEVSLVGGGTGTMYVDAATGVAAGWSLKRDGKEWLVFAKKPSLDGAPDAGLFAFAPPEGATKAVEAPPSLWAKASGVLRANCMPCHGEARQGRVDLRTYAATVQSAGVTAGDAAGSKLVQVVSGPRPRMPVGRAPLSAADVKAISDWIAAGAKEE